MNVTWLLYSVLTSFGIESEHFILPEKFSILFFVYFIAVYFFIIFFFYLIVLQILALFGVKSAKLTLYITFRYAHLVFLYGKYGFKYIYIMSRFYIKYALLMLRFSLKYLFFLLKLSLLTIKYWINKFNNFKD